MGYTLETEVQLNVRDLKGVQIHIFLLLIMVDSILSFGDYLGWLAFAFAVYFLFICFFYSKNIFS